MVMETQRPDVLERVLFVLAVLALALAPTQLTVTVKHIPLHPTELILLPAALVWAIRWVLRERTCRGLPPLTHWLVVFAAGIGFFMVSAVIMETLTARTFPPEELLQRTELLREARVSIAKETIQLILYLLLAYPIFRTALSTPRRLRAAVIALLVTTSLAMLLAVGQRTALRFGYAPDRSRQAAVDTFRPLRYDPDPQRRVVFDHFTPQAYLSAQQPMYVCSTFATWSEFGYNPSRAAYAGFLALVLPFVLALLVSERKRPGMVIWTSVLLLAAAFTVLAGYLAPAIMIGLLVTGFALGWRIGCLTLIGVVAYLLIVSLAGGFNRREIIEAPFQPRISAREAGYIPVYDEVRHLKKFWGEQQAALRVVRDYPLFGAGAGRYRQQVGLGQYWGGQQWGKLADVKSQRDEPNAVNGYLLVAATIGLLGLAALLLLYGSYLGMAGRAVRAGQGMPWSAALLGAMVALALITLATNPWVRGTSVVIAACLAAIGNFTTFSPDGRMINGYTDRSLIREDATCDQ
jgi:MFS family permease